ncbi:MULTISPECIES: sugar ABC transporter permease [unclassified Paenibacillus]|uniref:ABC transporter permease n=1 Tax=unclassified Paenibacillus TaxID=185978 RepID=UPI002406693F|nr:MULTISPECIES: sugar ABC transporter permease [unclassified Paenibacillus]MDF9841634.1 putative aldouronate transport system permease protein [Paenibacillus sp. PastF-2]MDF9848254.1 putative aldouronate transport system permease protein [Paenibacillus sp. PastM-2]MDF9854793.1 putative aldouronate transport system permease protein [Paenibacillus sp. PastF-1]MDH6480063.1 putative aldouronate transport system permease protein [Paenibacillus sp. PastH-2]MDH6507496.1 putative aldouronate transpor
MGNPIAASKPTMTNVYRRQRLRRMVRNKWLYIMLLPGLLYFIIFKYVPMYGLLLAFKNYQPFLGFVDSEWVGLKHFNRFFGDPLFWKLLSNTFILAAYNILFFFPLPIILALMLNELRSQAYKKWIQTMVYIPHFMSWVVIVSIAYLFFTTEGGLVNEAIASMGGEKIQFLLSPGWFRTFITGEVMWKETGWGTIIFLAALAGVDTQLYEAAKIDGAGRMRQLWHITLPAIRSTIIILLILRLGNFLDTGFEQIFLMLNSLNREVGEVFDTYVYTTGISQGEYSYSTAVGLFKSVVGLVLVFGSNFIAKRYGEEGIL